MFSRLGVLNALSTWYFELTVGLLGFNPILSWGRSVETEKTKERDEERDGGKDIGWTKGRKEEWIKGEKIYYFCNVCMKKIWNVIFHSKKKWKSENSTGFMS